MLLAVLALGILGTGIELLLLEHYEDWWQLVPLGLLLAGLLVLLGYAVRPGRRSLFVLRVTMAAFVLSGFAGIALHYRANVEFQREMDPEIRGSQLVAKALRAKTPPALAPGVMMQLGLLGLIYGYRGPHEAVSLEGEVR